MKARIKHGDDGNSDRNLQPTIFTDRGYFFNAYSPQTVFIAATSLGITGTVLFGLTVKEPKENQV